MFLLHFVVKLPMSLVLFLCHVASQLDSSKNFNLPHPWKSLCGWLSFHMQAEDGYYVACAKVIPAFEMVKTARNNVYHLKCFAYQHCNHRSVLPSLNGCKSCLSVETRFITKFCMHSLLHEFVAGMLHCSRFILRLYYVVYMAGEPMGGGKLCLARGIHCSPNFF
jgi:hypothetical protein